MSLWKQTPWDASLIACQLVEDALGYSDSASQPYGNPLGGLTVKLNGVAPSGASPPAPETDWIAVNYPFTSVQTIESIVGQLAQLGLGVGFDFGVDLAYTAGPGSPVAATLNVTWPRRGRTFAENQLTIDVQNARGYEIPEDGTQTANRVYELGGSGAIVVDENIYPLEQGYPLWEKVISRSTAQSQYLTSLLSQAGSLDLAAYSYAPVSPTVTIGVGETSPLPLGSYIVGDDVQLVIPELAADGEIYDPRFPQGMTAEWRITGARVTIDEEGNNAATLTLSQPPYLQALAPAGS